MTKENGDKGSPYLMPLELSKNPQGAPLIRIENLTIKMQNITHLFHLFGKPQRSNM